jgi:FtsH-binding integral membrane protein
MIAKRGLEAVGIDSVDGYVENYMFGNGIELHSVISDMWAWFGIPGLLLSFWMAGILISSLTRPRTDISVAPVAIAVSVRALFFLAFGPPASNLDDVILALAIVLPMTGVERAPAANRAGPATRRGRHKELEQ